jgi:sugar (pentulose or hexulose) kinase
VLALDVGTTWCKGLALARGGRIVAHCRRPTGIGTGASFSVEDSPPVFAGLRDTALATLGQLADGLKERCTVLGLGITAPFYPGVCLDAAGRPFGLPLGWSAPESLRHGMDADLHTTAGPLMLRLTALAPWRDRMRHAGSLINLVALELTGRWVTDPASGPGGLRWPAPVTRLVRPDALPAVVPFGTVIGGLTPGAAQATGLPSGLPVALGGHDGACANLGALASRPGDCCLTLSTNFVPRAVAAAPVPGLYGYPVGLAGWATATAARWAGRRIDLCAAACDGGPTAVGGMRHAALGAAAAVARAAGLRFSPPAGGEVSGQAARCRSFLLAGLTPGQVYGGAVHASLAEMLAILERAVAAGIRPVRYVATGGLAQSRFIVEELATMLGSEVEVAPGEAAARGAAAGAAVAAGWAPDIEAAAAALAPAGHGVKPRQG